VDKDKTGKYSTMGLGGEHTEEKPRDPTIQGLQVKKQVLGKVDWKSGGNVIESTNRQRRNEPRGDVKGWEEKSMSGEKLSLGGGCLSQIIMGYT